MKSLKVPRATTKQENVLISFLLLALLTLSNSLWAQTISIANYMDQYYGISTSSLKGNAINAIDYIAYVIAAPLCSFVGIKGALVLSTLLTLIGASMRVKWYIPDNNNEATGGYWGESTLNSFTSLFYGATGMIFANGIIASGEPFLYSFIATVSEKHVPISWRGKFIGASQMCSTFGYALGYIISINDISSPADFGDNFW